MQLLQFAALDGHGFANGRQPLHLLDELAGDIGERLRNADAQRRDPLDFALDRDAVQRVDHLRFTGLGELLYLLIGAFPRLPGFGLDLVEFALCVGLAAPRPVKWVRFYWQKVFRIAWSRLRTR